MEELNAQKEVLVSLADCCTVLQGKNVDKKKTNEEAQGLPVIVGASDLVCGALSPKRWCSQPLCNPVYSEKGDILVSVVGTIGKMAVNTVGRAILSKHVCACASVRAFHGNISWLWCRGLFSMPYPTRTGKPYSASRTRRMWRC